MKRQIAKIAVSAATYWIDKPYSYLVPKELKQKVYPGIRVLVPFSRSNRLCEGIVLDVSEETLERELKAVSSVLDSKPVLSPAMLKLSLWMRERYFCTVYDAVKAMLPAGLWYSLGSVCSIKAGYDREAAFEAAARSEKQRKVLEIIFEHGGKCD